MIELSEIGKEYGKVRVIESISMSIAKGEFVVLVGPSGSGKSTLLRMIAGLEDISRGDCMIADKRVNDLLPKSRGLAMVFQNYALYPHMTVFDNLAFALKVQGCLSGYPPNHTELLLQSRGQNGSTKKAPFHEKCRFSIHAKYLPSAAR
tara:strand:+ start:32 stop:478 length:447 start_codon:yes stop_codon:yes gene_type:complete